jgi:hypothetical protein
MRRYAKMTCCRVWVVALGGAPTHPHRIVRAFAEILDDGAAWR